MQMCKHSIGVNIFILLCFISSLQLIKANVERALFTQKLYDALSHYLIPQKTFVIAPNSIRDNLVILYFGASGVTKKQLHDAILLTGKEVKVSANYDTPKVINKKRLSFSTSNIIFVNENFELNNTFMDLTKELKLRRQYVDFSQPKITMQRINEWVRNSTTKERELPPLVNTKYFDKKSSGILVNLVSFYGVWKYKFESVEKQKFYTGRKEFRIVRMMIQRNNFKYNKIPRLNAEVIELPFDQKVSMMILLPDLVENGIPDLERALSNVNIFEISNQLNSTDVRVELPLFNYTTNSLLKRPLQRLGVKRAFSSTTAEFGEMFSPQNIDRPPYINNVVQQTNINIAIKLVQANSAAGAYSAKVKSYQNFTANRPFIYFIKDSNFIYIAGRYSK